MEKVKVIIEWASDGTISAMMEKDMFAGMGDTVKAAVADMKEGVALYIKTAKEMGFPYKAYLDGAYEIELEYDAVSALKYAREYIKDTKLAELTGIPAAQLGRYANDKSKPRPAQRRKIIEALHKFAAPFYSIVLWWIAVTGSYCLTTTYLETAAPGSLRGFFVIIWKYFKNLQ